MTDLMQYVPFLFLLLAIGAFAGVLAGLLGVGGGMVLVPAFYYSFAALGYESEVLMRICLATSLATIIVTSIRSVMSHHKKGAVEWGILRLYAPFIAIGAVLGMLTVASLRSDVLVISFAVLAFFVAIYMTAGKLTWRLGDDLPRGPKGMGVSTGIGFLSVLMGIGGGSFAVPFMTLYALPIHRAVATAAGFGLMIAVPSVLGFLFLDLPDGSTPPYTLGAVNIPSFLVVISMTTLTAPLGAKLAHAMDPKPLKRVFGIFLMLVAANMARKAIMG